MEFTNPTEIQGGFSDQLFNHPIIKDYIEECSELRCSMVFGYLGHENRFDDLDRQLEAICEVENIPMMVLAEWLISKNGRHFGDDIQKFDMDNAIRRFRYEINKTGLMIA